MTARWSWVGPRETPAEEWRRIADFPDYAVSNLGRVVSLKRPDRPHLLRPVIHVTGYKQVVLRYGGRNGASRRVHRLVAEAFIGPRPEGMEIRHIDGQKLNNHVSNLAYGTRSENIRDQVAHGDHANAAKRHCPQGHPYDEANTYYVAGRNHRKCRKCKRQGHREYRIRRALRAAGIPERAA